MNILLTTIQYIQGTILLAYFILAIAAIVRHRDWSLWRLAPLCGAFGIVAALLVAFLFQRNPTAIFLLTLPFFAFSGWRAWSGPSLLDRGLRMVSAFWFLYISASITLEYLGLP